MKVRYVVVIPFNNPHIHKPDPLPTDKARADRTVNRPEWWTERAKIFQQYTLQSLRSQTDQDFDTVLLIKPEHLKMAAPVVACLSREHREMVLTDGIAGLLSAYRSPAFDWVVWIHLDSDDMYRTDAIANYKKLPVKNGMAMLCKRGFIFGTDYPRMQSYDTKTTIPSFFGLAYPTSALQSIKAFKEYKDKYGLNKFHYQMGSCPVKSWMPDGSYCRTVSGTNVTTTWENKNVKPKLGRERIDLRNDGLLFRLLRSFGQ